jgi:PIN domain nuclease of toxin-antitoxin system
MVADVSVVSAWEAAFKILALAELPFHHRDPFDRMLIVQARQEGLTIVTADRKFEPHDAAILWT